MRETHEPGAGATGPDPEAPRSVVSAGPAESPDPGKAGGPESPDPGETEGSVG
jgi:hypothetical protein